MATTEQLVILTHADASGNTSVLYPVTTTDAVDGLEQMREEIEDTCKSYTDGKHMTAMVTLTASGWSGTAPYTQTVAMAGVLETDMPHFGIVYTENRDAETESFALVDQLDTENGKLTFTCFAEKPQADMTIQLEVNR